MDVNEKILTVGTRKSTNICECAKHRVTYNRNYDKTYCIYPKNFKLPALAKTQAYGISHHMGSDTKLSMIQYMYINTSENMYV